VTEKGSFVRPCLVDLGGDITLQGFEFPSNMAVILCLQNTNKVLGVDRPSGIFMIEGLAPNVSIREIIPSRR
jgi:hypothetical protein